MPVDLDAHKFMNFAVSEIADVKLPTDLAGEEKPTRLKNPPHPGLSVSADCLEPLGLRVTDAAKALGVLRQAVNNLIQGQSAISPEMAIRLDKAFGGADTWLRLQAAYDFAQAEKRRCD